MKHIEAMRQRNAELRGEVCRVFGFNADDLFWSEVEGGTALLDRHVGLSLTWRAGLLACPAYWGWFLKKWREHDGIILRDPMVTAELARMEGPDLRAAYLKAHQMRLHEDRVSVWEAGAVLAEAKPYVAALQAAELNGWLDEMHRKDDDMRALLARC